jgi:hypothetical protein
MPDNMEYWGVHIRLDKDKNRNRSNNLPSSAGHHRPPGRTLVAVQGLYNQPYPSFHLIFVVSKIRPAAASLIRPDIKPATGIAGGALAAPFLTSPIAEIKTSATGQVPGFLFTHSDSVIIWLLII